MAQNRVEVFPAMPPPLVAGRYEVQLDQEMAAVGGDNPLGDVAAETRHVEITAPRVAMPGTELFSTYPPPNAAGPFSTRLPQVALRRRTLPWERAMPPPPPPPEAPTVNPWLALVVVTADEATFLAGVKAPDAFTPAAAQALGIVDDGSRADAIEVTRTAVHQIFPRKDELHLLAHVRKVDVGDSELAGNDDDGWVAVLLSNRLPQPGLAYRACVVSLEGQFGALADPQPAVDDRPFKATVYADVSAETLAAAQFGGTGNPVPLVATSQPAVAPAGLLGDAPAQRDAWVQVAGGAAAGKVEPGSAPISPTDVGVVTFGGGFVSPRLDLAVLEPGVPRCRFPVLASWEFSCEGSGDFESLMQNLDVGLLGTLPAAEEVVEPATTVLETGHLEIDHRRRRGVSGRAWYRGPLTPREVARRPATVPFLAADQARRVATDGLEDLSEAAAFEIGRLLALAAPRFVAALRAWVRDGFTVRKTRRRLRDAGFPQVTGSELGLVHSLAGLNLLTQLAADGAAVLGPQVPIVDLGSFADQARQVDPLPLSVGLGLDVEFVANVLADGPTTAPLRDVPTAPVITDAETLGRNPALLSHLAGALANTVQQLAADARLQREPEGDR
jgi:hypothetical protein